MEKSLIFYPTSDIDRTPEELGLPYEDITFTTEDGVRLNGWFIPSPVGVLTLLWFHGNAGNISHRLDNIRLLHEKVKIHIFIWDYRGYGRSEGSVSEKGTYKDATAALKYLRSRKDLDPKKFVFYGRSLGAAVAVDLAVRDEPLALIIETAFTSIREMAKLAFPFLPIGPFLRTRYDTLEKIRQVQGPLLILHGDQDDIVPYAQGKRIFDAAPEPKEFYTIRGARHNDTFIVGGDPYFAALKDFIERAAALRSGG
ncbi:MAG: alpha/beta hydrolase [Acidobacteria bacterium]|nr:alpha/beta hydrolase [Acidobacteriota bacterium]